MSSRFEFVSRLARSSATNPQDMKKGKKQHGGFEAFVVAHATEFLRSRRRRRPAAYQGRPEDFRII